MSRGTPIGTPALSPEKKDALAARFGLTPPRPPAGAGPGRHHRHADDPLPPRQAWRLCPGEGIGPLKLGMTAGELEAALKRARESWAPANAPELEKQTDPALPGSESVTLRYMDGHVFVLARYLGGRAAEIAVDRMTAGRVNILVGDVPVFRLPAPEVSARLGLQPGALGREAPGLRLWQECPREHEPFDFAAVLRTPHSRPDKE